MSTFLLNPAPNVVNRRSFDVFEKLILESLSFRMQSLAMSQSVAIVAQFEMVSIDVLIFFATHSLPALRCCLEDT